LISFTFDGKFAVPRRTSMAFDSCSVCGATILFGAQFVGSEPCCPRCRPKAELLRDIQQAEESYKAALAQLKASPTSAELRERALDFGRKYAARTRSAAGQGNVTIFDEVALANDLQAACAAATAASPRGNEDAIEDRLLRLAELRDNKLISDQEFGERRQQILGEL
jgi:hypothetical protein